MSRLLILVLVLNVLGLTALAFLYPHLMISPDKLISAHAKLETDCFACHTPLFGASSDKCIACHKVADIGLRRVDGSPIVKDKPKVPFHQELVEQDCIACHSDHDGVIKFRFLQDFDHAMVAPARRKACMACHQRPDDGIHRKAPDTCSQCHSTEKWKPATFKHDLLPVAEREQCTECHKGKAPDDRLHNASGSQKCGQCHSTEKWKPATFDHTRWFAFDDDHWRCNTCHRTPDYKQYTCYFCHEHSEAEIRAEHLEEGIRDYADCVACHRSSDEDQAKRAWQKLRQGLPYVPEVSPRSGRSRTEERPSWMRERDDDD